MQLVDDVQEVQMPREHGWRKRQMSGSAKPTRRGTYFRNTETYMEVLILWVQDAQEQ